MRIKRRAVYSWNEIRSIGVVLPPGTEPPRDPDQPDFVIYAGEIFRMSDLPTEINPPAGWDALLSGLLIRWTTDGSDEVEIGEPG